MIGHGTIETRSHGEIFLQFSLNVIFLQHSCVKLRFQIGAFKRGPLRKYWLGFRNAPLGWPLLIKKKTLYEVNCFQNFMFTKVFKTGWKWLMANLPLLPVSHMIFWQKSKGFPLQSLRWFLAIVPLFNYLSLSNAASVPTSWNLWKWLKSNLNWLALSF